ncbi:GNAT family N-acetyltransferase [Sporosarcina sp. Te-1]|uniref:GNAT family N-acetyltransferase n=1 Tax=Sporosarcina sp. Te-1 TaxID=2818390 RepID=UPI001A9D678E|nr:GNAT family N-acetyltransferase [Sporosarcina sp. Te-1]QTD42995.1 GNAT family N-acetyltransferase [Sporosarcina sp. Te-1]
MKNVISELKKSEFHKCLTILNEQGQVEAKAIIAGTNPGRVFVDNPQAPTSGLIWLGNHDGFIFIGDENNKQFNNELNAFIDSVIVPDAEKVGLKWFEGVGNHSKWDNTIKRLFTHRKVKVGSWLQRVYGLPKENYNQASEPTLEQGYTIHKITKTLYENQNDSIKNIDFLHDTIVWSWSSADHFLSEGIGYCIVYDDEIVSICSSSFVFENIQCIGIETLQAHQGKKLAQIAAHRFIKDCFENNRVPYWDCMDGNKPSIAVAERLGFCRSFNYMGYEFSF